MPISRLVARSGNVNASLGDDGGNEDNPFEGHCNEGNSVTDVACS